jgi:hypothetical protein
MKRVRVTMFALEKQYVLHILSVWLYSCLSHLTCKAQAPHYIAIYGMFDSIILLSIISKIAQFSKKKKNIEPKMCVLIVSTNLSEIFLIQFFFHNLLDASKNGLDARKESDDKYEGSSKAILSENHSYRLTVTTATLIQSLKKNLNRHGTTIDHNYFVHLNVLLMSNTCYMFRLYFKPLSFIGIKMCNRAEY